MEALATYRRPPSQPNRLDGNVRLAENFDRASQAMIDGL